MRNIRYFIIIVLLASILFALEFPISAFQCNDTMWFAGAGGDSLGLNLVHYGWKGVTKTNLLGTLNAAQEKGLKIIMNNATTGGAGRGDIRWYCQLYWGRWEAEESSNFFWNTNFWHGKIVEDDFANNDTALVAYAASMSAGNMLKTHCEHMHQYESMKIYYIIYQLKIDSLSLATLPEDAPICSLYITRVCHVPLIGKTLTRGDFSSARAYQACTLVYNCPDTLEQLYYGLYWFDKSDLWCDYIEAKDRYIDTLIFHHDYDDTLRQITKIYDSHPALAYYYLLDEPYMSYLAANSYIMNYLSYPHKPGLQTVYYDFNNPNWFYAYVDSVDPKVLAVDCYPLRGAVESAYTPKESGPVFQGRLDTLCLVLNAARAAAMHKGIPFWYVCQSFGQYSSTGATYGLREPTPRELKCMIWLGLAYGAKGIDHFLYRVYNEAHGSIWCYDSGLTRNGYPRYPLWTVAKEMNIVLKEIGPRLLSLESDAVFKSTDNIPLNCFISYISSDVTVQVGTFHNVVNDTFFIIVNRLCRISDSGMVTVKIHKDKLLLYDEYLHQTIAPDSIPAGNSCFSMSLQPGSGKLLRLVPFAVGF